jgi:hypothetical protein
MESQQSDQIQEFEQLIVESLEVKNLHLLAPNPFNNAPSCLA